MWPHFPALKSIVRIGSNRNGWLLEVFWFSCLSMFQLRYHIAFKPTPSDSNQSFNLIIFSKIFSHSWWDQKSFLNLFSTTLSQKLISILDHISKKISWLWAKKLISILDHISKKISSKKWFKLNDWFESDRVGLKAIC